MRRGRVDREIAEMGKSRVQAVAEEKEENGNRTREARCRKRAAARADYPRKGPRRVPGGGGAIRKGMREEQTQERTQGTEQESRRLVAGGLAMPVRCCPCAPKRLPLLYLAVGSGLGLAFAIFSHTAI